MHYRRFACFILGAWLAGSLLMMMVATQNFRSVDRLLAGPAPAAAKHIQTLGKEPARVFLRHQISEQNRWYFQTWEKVQLGLGALLLLTLLFGAEARPFMVIVSVLMLTAVGLMHWLFTPEIVRLGRAIDFLPPAAASADRDRFWHFHTAYSTTDVIKTGLGFLLAGRLLLRRRRRNADFLDELDVIDDADHSHIDR